MKLRQHRGGLSESMATVVNIEPTKKALVEEITKQYKDVIDMGMVSVDESTVSVESYGGMDERIGWDTYIVMIKNWGPYGFTDGPLLDETKSKA
jgi:hypothetical protein